MKFCLAIRLPHRGAGNCREFGQSPGGRSSRALKRSKDHDTSRPARSGQVWCWYVRPECVLGTRSSEFARRIRAGNCAALSAAGRWEGREVFAFVFAYPEADGPRFLAADWLADDAQWERAEFIRAQCELSKLVDVHGAGASTRPEAAELLDEQRRFAVGALLTTDGGSDPRRPRPLDDRRR